MSPEENNELMNSWRNGERKPLRRFSRKLRSRKPPQMKNLGLMIWVLAATLGLGCGPTPTSRDPSTIPVSQDPAQEAPAETMGLHVSSGGWDCTLTPLAAYTLRGVVLGRENYYSGWNTSLSPCDVAMAWGPLTSGKLWKRLSWSQTGRWYYWEYDSDFPYDNTFVGRYSSNTHIIPANANLSRAVRNLGKGDIAELVGELVRVEGKRGEQTVSWASSQSRQDTGDGSCEVLYLRRLKVDGKVYE
jgi:hypothetical protein